jgi:pimeloyl-ACP methyl ester carboxylesterase
MINCFDVYGPGQLAARDSINQRVREPFRSDFGEECRLWQERFADDASRAAVRSDVPALILTAEFDDRTPTENGHQIAAALSRAWVFELPGAGHGSVAPPQQACVNGVIAAFLATPTRAPHATCIAQQPTVQFRTSWGGGGGG